MKARLIFYHKAPADIVNQIRTAVRRVLCNRRGADDYFYFYYFDISTVTNGYLCEIVRGKEAEYSPCKGWYGGDYYASIEYDKNNKSGKPYALFEAYVKCGDGQTQINDFGEFETFAKAFSNLMRHGNTTCDNRKPINVYL